MKALFTLITCILYQTSFGQFGVIFDKDGFVNVRNSPSISNNIIDTLTNGEVVYCLEAEGEWCPMDYDLGGQGKSGYIHKSRVKFIEGFDKIDFEGLTDFTIRFKKDSIKLVITKIKFNSKNNELQYHIGDASENEGSWLEKINGKEFWGTDGNIPENQYGQMTLTLGNNRIDLPVENLFEPNLDHTTVNVDSENKVIYVTAMNSDGAGGYAVLWIIENGKCKQRIITIPF
jgi:hypothetical protein